MMKKRILHHLITALLLLCAVVFMTENSHSQPLQSRFKDQLQHRNGKIWVWVTNFGQFGTDADGGALFPGTHRATETRYINKGGLILGGILPANGILNPAGMMDTLVSEGPSMWSVTDFRELLPHYADIELSKIRIRSNNTSWMYCGENVYSPYAVSPEDFIAVYTDTFTAATGLGPAKHRRALGLEIEERSYQFSESYAEDFIFFDLTIRNIGRDTIRQFYAGFFANVHAGTRGYSLSDVDDISGFMEFNAAGERVNVAWAAQSDGDHGYTPGCVGVRILRPTERDGRVSYNWWMSDTDLSSSDDWGPRTAARNEGDNPVVDPKDPYGSPEQDEDKYVLLCNGSFDPQQFNPETQEWNPDIPVTADPNDNSRFMIAFGPLGTDTGELFATPRGTEPLTLFYPGDSVLFTYAIIGGEGDFETSAALGTTDPQAFTDLGMNASIARNMFDIDYDGVPEFTGPQSPPSPPLTYTTDYGKVILDWSEADPSISGYGMHGVPPDELPLTFQDPFILDDPATEENESEDFEGFIVMRSPDDRISNFEEIVVFDKTGNSVGPNTGLRYTYTDYVPSGTTMYYAVVSFDRGIPEIELESLRSSPIHNMTKITVGAPPNTGLVQKIWVEPNPYIGRSGFEPTELTSSNYIEHNRALDFVNLPEKCTIRIFTVDLDLVQTLYHDDVTSRHRWDMLTRSIMPIRSGIYIFTVDDGKGNVQFGKFVVIK
ncbi:hypothetical protein ACFL6I_12575 [candidate division KSB1 bacterium]